MSGKGFCAPSCLRLLLLLLSLLPTANATCGVGFSTTCIPDSLVRVDDPTVTFADSAVANDASFFVCPRAAPFFCGLSFCYQVLNDLHLIWAIEVRCCVNASDGNRAVSKFCGTKTGPTDWNAPPFNEFSVMASPGATANFFEYWPTQAEHVVESRREFLLLLCHQPGRRRRLPVERRDLLRRASACVLGIMYFKLKLLSDLFAMDSLGCEVRFAHYIKDKLDSQHRYHLLGSLCSNGILAGRFTTSQSSISYTTTKPYGYLMPILVQIVLQVAHSKASSNHYWLKFRIRV